MVRWQFAPGTWVKVLGARTFVINRKDAAMAIEVSDDWDTVSFIESPDQAQQVPGEHPLAGTVSPAFRKVEWAPYLKLEARPGNDKPCVFRTTFLASAPT